MNRKHSIAAALALALFAVAPASQASEWKWVAAPYLWASSIGTDLHEDAPPVGGTTEFNSIISKLDMAFQGHVEGQGDRFGVFADLTYISLSDDHEFTGFDTEASVDTTMFELAGVWNVEPTRYEGLDVFAGMRHIIADTSLKIDPALAPLPDVEVGFDQSYTDLMVGARYTAKLSDKWKMITRVDGGWGDTDGTLNASLLFARKGGKGSWLFGYRYMDIELQQDGTDIDVTMAGPMLAYAFGLD